MEQEDVFCEAIRHWWKSKNRKGSKGGRSQGGTRDSNLRGDTMDGFRITLCERLEGIGVRGNDVFFGGALSRLPANLPSYFRASKNWDVIVCKNSIYKGKRNGASPTLIAAIEFKSQFGSIGNNQNNRIEESIGNAADFWASYENRNFLALQPRPWLGYLFVGKYEPEDLTKPVRIKQPHFPSDPAFIRSNDGHYRVTKNQELGPSYSERYRIFLERMIAKKQYDGAALIATNPKISKTPCNYICPYSELSGARFLDGLLRHVGAYYE